MGRAPNRFSLAVLMAFIGVVAVGLGLMRNGSLLASRIALVVLPVVLLVGLLGALVRRGEASWIGFALFGWGYALLAFAFPTEVNYFRRLNPGSDLVDELVNRLHPETVVKPTTPFFNSQFESMLGNRSGLRWIRTGPGMNPGLRGLLSPAEVKTLDDYLVQLDSHESESFLLVGRKANAGVVGHALFALIFALVGTVLGRALGGSAEARPSRQPG